VCTVTWIQQPDRYSLFCNRDELRSRQAALPPAQQQTDGVRFLAPTDGDAGGTWIAVNEHGLSLCLLNDYSSKPPMRDDDFTSRGLLVRDLIRATHLHNLEKMWALVDPRDYRPFKLLALFPGEEARLLTWSGREAQVAPDPVAPLCSSSFDEKGATRVRRDQLRDLGASTDLDPHKRRLRFHQSHLPERGPYSVCMHRPDAVTVSFTLVEVDAAGVSMAYAHGAPCSASLEHLSTLDRKSVVEL
jgi:hypothetical protein